MTSNIPAFPCLPPGVTANPGGDLINCRAEDGSTPLWAASFGSQPLVVMELIEAAADVNACACDGMFNV